MARAHGTTASAMVADVEALSGLELVDHTVPNGLGQGLKS
jgi:hypothetical protein